MFICNSCKNHGEVIKEITHKEDCFYKLEIIIFKNELPNSCFDQVNLKDDGNFEIINSYNEKEEVKLECDLITECGNYGVKIYKNENGKLVINLENLLINSSENIK